MAFWTMPCRLDAMDRDTNFYWQDLDGMGDGSDNLFGEFVDFNGEATASATDMNGSASVDHGKPDPFFLGHQAESTTSSGSTADELDFLSSSSQLGPTASSISQDIDPHSLSAPHEPDFQQMIPNQSYYGHGSISDTELPNLEGISLYSPMKNVPASHPSSPTPPNTTVRKPNKFVEALSSTIKKATTLRRGRKPIPDRSGSPEPDMPLKVTKQRAAPRTQTMKAKVSVSPPVQPGAHPGFIHGFCDDPFNEPQHPNAPFRFFSQDGFQTPHDSPIKTEPGAYHNEHPMAQAPPNWSQPTAPGPEQWSGPEYVASQQEGWWDVNLLGPGVVDEHAKLNMALHNQHAELPYEYYAPPPLPDPSDAGLMIHMPQPRPPQPTVVSSDIALSAHTYLPPPPPVPASDQRPRPPRARSSGARHMSLSPKRKPRAPSAPASPQTPSGARSRHSSGGSVSSTTSRLPGSMPGTPCSVRKRRSRDASGDMGGFVNFTPSDGGMLMTGVAPSGSSKTKARREKEASERRRRLSEAAMKAVAAAGGDVEKLMEHGFAF